MKYVTVKLAFQSSPTLYFYEMHPVLYFDKEH